MDLWNWAEPGYKETRSSARLAAMLLSSGFRIQEGVSGIPTAFVAESGSGSPIIGILGEFDALPGLSQTAAPRKEARKDGNGYGHACGHHLFGVASAAAAIAIATSLQTSGDPGTVRFYGTPAEEGGAAKVFMTRDGLFADCDAVLHWHPSSMTAAGDPTCLARVAAKFRFKGISSHAAVAPERDRKSVV